MLRPVWLFRNRHWLASSVCGRLPTTHGACAPHAKVSFTFSMYLWIGLCTTEVCGLQCREPAVGVGVVWRVHVLGVLGPTPRPGCAPVLRALRVHGLVVRQANKDDAGIGWALLVVARVLHQHPSGCASQPFCRAPFVTARWQCQPHQVLQRPRRQRLVHQGQVQHTRC